MNKISLILLTFTITPILTAPPSSQTWPKLKNYDIWGSPTNKLDTSKTNKLDELVYNSNNENSTRNGKVLNFFPVPVDDECLSDDGRRSGVCLNVYECRIQGGTSKGDCALGFGVCCVFTATCDQEVFNNLTYIVSPSFPAIMPLDVTSCKLKIKMIDPDISQLRFDFIHFSLGQPNRRTGICDGDSLSLTGGQSSDFILCGQNSGQHLYYDISGKSREDGIELNINMPNKGFVSRLWEIRVSQIPFSQRAPAGCFQYFQGINGIIQTFNFATNGRHLANHNYKSCVRQETGMCSIGYEPCDDQSFRIGQNPSMGSQGGGSTGQGGGLFGMDSIFGSMQGIFGTGGQGVGGTNPVQADGVNGIQADSPINGDAAGDSPLGDGSLGDSPLEDSPVNDEPLADEPLADEPVSDDVDDDDDGGFFGDDDDDDDDGGGLFGDDSEAAADDTGASDGVADDDAGDAADTQSDDPQADDPDSAEGSGGGGGGFFSFANFFGRSMDNNHNHRQGKQFFKVCTDRITLPCIVEDFIGAGMGDIGCQPVHCGNTMCRSGSSPCRIETSVTPFAIGVHFGEGVDKGSPDENIGACLRYNQIACL